MSDQQERTDAAGRWESTDGGASWALVAPSQAWLNARPDEAAVEAPPSPLDVFDAAATGTLSLAKLKTAMRAALEALDG